MTARCAAAALGLLTLCAVAVTACVGRSFQPSPTQKPAVSGSSLSVGCLSADEGDREITGSDLALERIVDLNLDGHVDQADIDTMGVLDINLDTACAGDDEFAIEPAASGPPACPAPFILVVGITGSAAHGLTNKDEAGIPSLVHALRAELESKNMAVADVIAAPDIQNAHLHQAAMESWLELFLNGVFAAHPCARAVLLGHSYGATSALAVASWLDQNGAGQRVLVAGIIDRVTSEYDGVGDAVPKAPVFHVYESDPTQTRCKRDDDSQPDPVGAPLLKLRAGNKSIVEIDFARFGLCHFDIVRDASVHDTLIGVSLFYIERGP